MKITFRNSKQQQPTEQDGFNVTYAPAKRIAFKARWYMLLAIVMSPIVLLLWYIFSEKLLIAADGILTTEPVELNAFQRGYVEELFVKPGDYVEKNDIIMHFRAPRVEQDLKLLRQRIDDLKYQNKASLAKIKLLHQQQISDFISALASNNQIQKEYAEGNRDDLLTLADRLMLERLEVEVKRDYNKALLDYQWAIENHQNGPISKSIVDLERDINRLLVTQSELNVRAPNAGVINDLYVNEGEYLLEGASLAKLSNRVQPVVMVFLPPNRLEYGKIGNRATVTLPDGTSVVGVVSEPTQMANRIPRSLAGPFEDGKVAVQVTLSLETDISNFVEGLPIRVRFYYFE